MKKWLAAQPDQPTTISELQRLVDAFVTEYNQHRPHRSLPHRLLPHRATPATVYTARPKAGPGTDRSSDLHDRVRSDRVRSDRVRSDRIDTTGCVTLRVAGKLRHISVGRTHARTHVLLLVHDLDVRIINATTGEILRELTIDLTKDYQPRGTGRPK